MVSCEGAAGNTGITGRGRTCGLVQDAVGGLGPHFLAHVMTYGTIEDLRALEGFVGQSEFEETLEHPPPGVFDARSWADWNLKCGRTATPLPVNE